ncbi:putative rRNA methyltransferase YlbH isoform X2 [Telopea speciosissima]|uniref:putative rRNA methyltransferase YlbH isoform X2 n=1 Tax=Telopea speciosissima TaxID=54955 RepID=UPI001CC5829E|nr:putative rRNA methyltransferase YlbH isoform X2 [Telopea speciosissima]
MAAVSSSVLPPLSSPSGIKNRSNGSSLLVPLFIVASPKQSKFRPPTVVISSYNSRNGTVSDSKKELLESYGLDPDEFLAQPSSFSKSRRRKEAEGAGRGKRNSPEQPSPPPRTTHKLLQVLGGKARRKKLLSPKGMDVRPMMEVVKGAAFDILQVAGGCPASLRPGRWLDLYSGTGSVGIEAISRGCSEVHFVEMDPWVVSKVLRPNLEWTGFLDVSMIHTVRVENFLERAEQFVDKNGQVDYISVTPPYTVVDYSILMGQLSSSALVGENTFIVVEYPLRTAMLDSCGSLVKITDRRFGRTHLAIYGPTWAQKKKKKKSENSVLTVAAMSPLHMESIR